MKASFVAVKVHRAELVYLGSTYERRFGIRQTAKKMANPTGKRAVANDPALRRGDPQCKPDLSVLRDLRTQFSMWLTDIARPALPESLIGP